MAALEGVGRALNMTPTLERPSTPTTQENICRIHQMLMDDERLTVNHITDVMSISRERVENILHMELGMPKVLVRWKPRLLTPD